MQESDIIEMLRKQHPSGADELISHYGPLMQYIIKPIVSNEQDREECLSEAVMRILDSLSLSVYFTKRENSEGKANSLIFCRCWIKAELDGE